MRVKLGDICESGASNLKQSDVLEQTGEYPVYGAAGYVSSVNFYHQEKPYVAIVKDGAGVGRTMLLPEKTSVIGTMQYLLPKEDVLPEYLYYVVKSKHLESYYKGAAIPHIYFRDYQKEEIELFDKNKQNEVINILENIEGVIDNQKKELELFDELVKARFVEMFVGKNYPSLSMDDLSIAKGEYGAGSASIEYDPSRPRYVRITDINDDGTLNDDYVSSINEEDDEIYKLSYGDFLFARMGATVGKTYAYKDGNQIFAGYLIRYKLNPEKILPEYLYTYTKLEEYKKWVELNQSGAAQPGINAKKYGSLLIPVAPIDKQKGFVEFVKQVDKSKFIVQKIIEKYQELMDKLMDEYFGNNE